MNSRTDHHARVLVACLVCVGLLSTRCTPNRTIAGFPILATADYKTCMASARAEIQAIRTHIDSASEDSLQKKAYHTLFDALLVLSGDHPDYFFLSSEYENFLFKQVLPPSIRPPLQLYPRLTHAHIAELVDFESGRKGWLVPFVLSRRGLARAIPTRFGAFLQRIGCSLKDTRVNRAALRRNLSFWLEPYDRSGQQANRWIPADPWDLPDLAIRTSEEGEYNPMQPDSSAVGLVFKICQSNPLNEKSESTRGFYHLRILPKIPELRGRFESGFAVCLADGD